MSYVLVFISSGACHCGSLHHLVVQRLAPHCSCQLADPTHLATSHGMLCNIIRMPGVPQVLVAGGQADTQIIDTAQVRHVCATDKLNTVGN